MNTPKKTLKWDPDYLWKYNLENWYDYVKDIRVANKPICSQNIISEQLTSEEIQAFIDADIDKLDNLGKRLQKKMDPYTEYFSRLGTRSPKDARGFLLPQSFPDEVFKLLIGSRRVFEDMKFYFEAEEKYPIVLHLLPWRKFDTSKEIRTFIKNGQLIGISHYNMESQFPYIDREEELVHRVNKFIKTYLSDLPFETYTLDLEITNDFIYLVEFNHFKQGMTCTCLLDWDSINNFIFDGNITIVYKNLKKETTKVIVNIFNDEFPSDSTF